MKPHPELEQKTNLTKWSRFNFNLLNPEPQGDPVLAAVPACDVVTECHTKTEGACLDNQDSAR